MSNDAIFDAIEYDDIDQLEELIEEASDSELEQLLNEPDGEGYSPLIVAASIGLVDIAEVLLENNAKIDYIAPDHASALFCAVQEKHWELVSLLHDHKANMNSQRDKGPTPLYIAAQEGYADMVGRLVEIGADPDLRAHGITPLFIACQENHPEVVTTLLQKKADPNRRNKSGGLPVVVSAWRNNTKVLEELVKAEDLKIDKFGGANMSALMTASKNKKTESVKILVGAKADCDKKCDSSFRATALHYAADKHYIEIMNMLKDDGAADTSIKNANGHTAADMIMLNYDEYLEGYAHTSLTLAADRKLKTLEKEPEPKKEAEPLPEEGTDSEIEDEEHLVGWSAPKEETINTKRIETQAEKDEKQELKRQASQRKMDAAKASPKKKEKKKKEKKKRSKRSKRRSSKSKEAVSPSNNHDSDDATSPAAATTKKRDMSPEDRLQSLLTRNENKLDIIREAFTGHDIDDSGYLDKPEFMACLGSLGLQEQFGRDFKAHVNKCFAEFDKDQNGRISFEEFVQFYNTINNPSRTHVRRNKTPPRPAPMERPKAGNGRRRLSKGSLDMDHVNPKRGGQNFLPTL